MRPDEIAVLLRRAIRERLLVPGQSLNQDDLARRFGVSRIPLREALRTLVGEGLVMMRPGIGAVVTELDPSELDELLSLREQLEPPLVAAAVDKMGPVQVAQLRDILQTMTGLAEADREAWTTQDYVFHRRIYEFAQRPHSARLAIQVLNLMEPYVRLQVAHAGVPEQERDHASVVDAIERGDAELASQLVSSAIARLRKDLGSYFAADTDSDPLAMLRDSLPGSAVSPPAAAS